MEKIFFFCPGLYGFASEHTHQFTRICQFSFSVNRNQWLGSKILYKDSGDRSGNVSHQREPMFMERLSETHSRIKILNHKLRSKMTQTDNIRTIDNDEDAVKLLDSRKKHDRSVHCKR